MTQDEFQTQIIKKLDNLIFWVRISNLEAAREYFKSVLDNEQKISVYKLTNGENTIDKILAATGIKSKGTVSTYWTEWMGKELLENLQRIRAEKKV